MTLAEVINASHTEDMVIYEGYHGDKQLPIIETTYSNGKIPFALKNYGHREVCIIEAACDTLHIWIEEE